jgi:hypothetical protein
MTYLGFLPDKMQIDDNVIVSSDAIVTPSVRLKASFGVTPYMLPVRLRLNVRSAHARDLNRGR